MEPLSALSIAASVIQFVDFSSKFISETVEIYKSSQKTTKWSSDIQNLTQKFQDLALNLEKSLTEGELQDQEPSANEVALLELCSNCKEVSQQFVDTLREIQRTGKGGKLDSARQAIRNMWSKDRVETLQRGVSEFRQQLTLNILISLRERLTSIEQQNSSRTQDGEHNAMGQIVHQLMKHIEDSKRWQSDLIKAIQKNHSTDEQESAVLVLALNPNLAEKYITVLLDQLDYSALEDRYQHIANSYGETFQWVLERKPYHETSWSDFVEWLQIGASPYWISGKPGSGKSTLMKYISQDPRTRMHLATWAQNSDVIVAGFYFWNSSGIEIQMSQEGLFRTLLFKSLSQVQELVPRVFPRRWRRLVARGILDDSEFTRTELEKALEVLVRATSKDLKFCFFIDGLDEFQGKPLELINLLKHLASLSPHLKLCLSSRSWIEFEQAFKDGPRMLLQDLTYPDIIHYISSNLHSHPNFSELELLEPQYAMRLTKEIANKASGVFLWVVLVVASLLEGLTCGDRLVDLQHRLDELPEDLNELFTKILDSIDARYWMRVSQLLQVVRTSMVPLTLLTLSFADEEDTDLYRKNGNKATQRCCKGGEGETNANPCEPYQ